LRAERICRFQIRTGHFVVDSHGRRAFDLVVNGDVKMPAPNALPDYLANARLHRLEPFRNAQVQIEEAMIDAANRNAKAPAILDGASLRIAGHRLEARRAGF